MSIEVGTTIICDNCGARSEVVTGNIQSHEARKLREATGWQRRNVSRRRPGMVTWADLCPTCTDEHDIRYSSQS